MEDQKSKNKEATADKDQIQDQINQKLQEIDNKTPKDSQPSSNKPVSENKKGNKKDSRKKMKVYQEVTELLRNYLTGDQKLVSLALSNFVKIEGHPMFLLSTEFCSALFNEEEYSADINADLISSLDSLLVDPLPQKSYQNVLLKEGLREQESYLLIPKEIWSKIKSKQKLKSIEIKRFVQPVDPTSTPELSVEVSLLKIQICLKGDIKLVLVSKNDRVEDLIGKIKRSHKLESVRLWKVPKDQLQEVVEILNKGEQSEVQFQQLRDLAYISQIPLSEDYIFVADCSSPPVLKPAQKQSDFFSKFSRELSLIQENTDELIAIYYKQVEEQIIKEEEELLKLKASQPSVSKTSQDLYRYLDCDLADMLEKSTRKGLVGLQNIGNTCFMNSALQCLSNCDKLTKYFLLRLHEFEINASNPLGTGGKLTQAYADLIKDIWQKSGKSTIPWTFKQQISKRASQFAGFAQQDSAELLTYVLDALHEDLNQIDKKPYVEFNDRDNRPDHIVSQEFWNGFLKRNQSIIVDLMYGQLKSRLQCKKCNRVSTTFDPFLTLQLPIPIFTKQKLYFLSQDYSSPIIELEFQLNDDQSVKEVKDLLSSSLSISSEKLVLARYENNEIQEYCKSTAYFRTYTWRGGIVIAIQLDENIEDVQGDKMGFVEVLVMQRAEKQAKRVTVSRIITFKMDMTVKALKDKIWGMFEKVQKNAKDQCKLKVLNNLPLEDYAKKIQVECDICFQQHSDNCEFKHENEDEMIMQDFQSDRKIRREFMLIVEFQNPQANTSKTSQVKSLSGGSIDINDIQHNKSKQMNGEEKDAKISLIDCLNQFRTNELLSGDDMWYCSDCQDHVPAFKQMEIYKTPDYLCIQLKRFIQQKSQYFYQGVSRKISDFIDYPVNGLDLTDYVLTHSEGPNKEKLIYDLYGVTNHMGSLYGGHYTAYAKNPLDQEWYEYDDSRVNQAREGEVVSRAGYVLFYKKRTC